MRIAGLVLAAGASSRYRAGGGPLPTKLVELFEGEPMVRRAARAALEAGLEPVVVVTGHAQAAVEAVLAGLALTFVHNPDFAAGLSTSLRTGLDVLDPSVEAVAVLLGDMPLVGRDVVERLVAAVAAHPAAQAVVPVTDRLRGNPVLLRAALFPAARRLAGDEGARRMLRDAAIDVFELALDDPATRFDIDEAGGDAPR